MQTSLETLEKINIRKKNGFGLTQVCLNPGSKSNAIYFRRLQNFLILKLKKNEEKEKEKSEEEKEQKEEGKWSEGGESEKEEKERA